MDWRIENSTVLVPTLRVGTRKVAGEGFLEEDIKVTVAQDPFLWRGLCFLCGSD
jgi:hypothetical protein